VKVVDPPRILMYAPPKTGKTHFAAEFPNPVFIQTEDGTSGELELNTFGVMETFQEVLEAINALASEEHDFKTAVLDTIDALEPMIWKHVCDKNGWRTIKDPGYGDGYVAAAAEWQSLLKALDYLRRVKRMNIIMLGHSSVSKFDPPGMESYNRYELRVHKRAADLLTDDCDAILFMNNRTEIQSEDVGFGKTRNHASGGGTRWIYSEFRPAHEAGNRYALEPEFPYIKGAIVQTLLNGKMPISGA
jgi:hypothetical protein